MKRPQAGGSALTDCPWCHGTGYRHTVDGDQIRRWRKAARLSLRATAALAKCSAMYVCDIEGGRRRPTPDNPIVNRLVRALIARQPCVQHPEAAG